MKTRLMLFGLLLLGYDTSIAQDLASDSKGKSVFNWYSFNDYKINVSTSEPLNIGVSLKRLLTSIDLEDKDSSIVRSSDFYINYGLLNSGDQLDFSKLNDNKFGHSLKFGFQSAVIDIENLNRFLFFKGVSGGVSLFYNIDNFNYMNSTTLIESSETPASYGFELNSSVFITTRNPFSKLTFLAALEVKYFVKTWNDDELLNYQIGENYTQNGTVVAMEDFRGKYGLLRKDISKLRIVGSFPIYYRHFNFTPYTVLTDISDAKPTYRTGTNFNIIQTPINPNDLNFGSSFGIGIDWLHEDGEWSQANIFLRGSISLGKI